MSQTSTDACPFANWNPFLSDYPFQANTDLVPIINSTVDYFTTQLTMRLDDLQQDEFEALLTETICFIDATQIRSIPNIKFAVEIKQNPSRFLHALNLSATIAAQVYTEKFPWAQIQVNEKIVRILNYSNHTRLKDLKANMVGQFITIRGTAVRVSSVLPLVTTLEFQCTNCGTRQTTLFPDGKYKTLLKCTLHGCRGKNFKPDKSNGKTNSSIDWQRVRIQEKLANDQVDSGRVPRTVECELTRDLVDKIVPGDVVICTGIVKVLATEEGGNKNTTAQMYYLYIDANSINKTSCALDEEEGGSLAGKDFIEFSEKDLYGILEIHNFEGDLFQLLVHSLCPAIFGHEFVKAGILLTLMGGRKRETSVNQLKIRSDPHILVVGDPGLGKSQMLMSAVKLAPRGVYVAGNTSTTAGLTVTVCKDSDTGDTALEAGALVLGDQGVCCIDEFDKMTDHHALLEAMEQQSISIAKAGIVCSLPTRTSIIAAANPVGGHYNKTKTVSENLKMNAALLSRFDLIFILLDKPDENMDRFLSDHIMKIHRGGNDTKIDSQFLPEAVPVDSNSEYSLKNRLCRLTKENDPIPTSLLRKYISYARTYSQPRLSEEASALIQEFYMELRQKHRSGEGTPITTRQLESMIRLSEARARCELRDIVTAADARDIIQIMKYSLWDSYSSDDLGTVDFARSQMGTGSSRQKDGKNLMAVLNRKAYETGKKNFTMDQIEKFAYDINIREGVRELVDRVNNQGYLINKGGGVYQITM